MCVCGEGGGGGIMGMLAIIHLVKQSNLVNILSSCNRHYEINQNVNYFYFMRLYFHDHA